MKEILKAENLCFSYYKKPLCLKDVCLSISAGEKIALLGRNETGKRTLVNVLSLFEKTTFFGKILYHGKNIKEVSDLEKSVSVLYQTPVLFERKTIKQNLEFLFKVIQKKVPDDSALEKYLKDFEIDADLHSKVKKLSLLNKRKLAILRSFLKESELVFVLDQFVGLSPEECDEMKKIYQKLSSEDKKAVVFVVESDSFRNNEKYFVDFGFDKIWFLSLATLSEYKNFKEILDNPINLDYFKYIKIAEAMSADIVKTTKGYILLYGKEEELIIPSKYSEKLDAVNFEDIGIENVLVLSKIDGTFENFNAKVFVHGIEKKEIFVCSKIDGARLI